MLNVPLFIAVVGLSITICLAHTSNNKLREEIKSSHSSCHPIEQVSDGRKFTTELGGHKYTILELDEYDDLFAHADADIKRGMEARERDAELRTIVKAMERGRKICTRADYQFQWFVHCGTGPKGENGDSPCEIEVPVCVGKWVERK